MRQRGESHSLILVFFFCAFMLIPSARADDIGTDARRRVSAAISAWSDALALSLLSTVNAAEVNTRLNQISSVIELANNPELYPNGSANEILQEIRGLSYAVRKMREDSTRPSNERISPQCRDSQLLSSQAQEMLSHYEQRVFPPNVLDVEEAARLLEGAQSVCTESQMEGRLAMCRELFRAGILAARNLQWVVGVNDLFERLRARELEILAREVLGSGTTLTFTRRCQRLLNFLSRIVTSEDQMRNGQRIKLTRECMRGNVPVKSVTSYCNMSLTCVTHREAYEESTKEPLCRVVMQTAGHCLRHRQQSEDGLVCTLSSLSGLDFAGNELFTLSSAELHVEEFAENEAILMFADIPCSQVLTPLHLPMFSTLQEGQACTVRARRFRPDAKGEFIFLRGIVSLLPEEDNEGCEEAGCLRCRIDHASVEPGQHIEPGCSGAPVYNEQEQVIGCTSFINENSAHRCYYAVPFTNKFVRRRNELCQ